MTSPPPTRQLRLFRRLVRALFPEDFRAGYEAEMAATFGAQQRKAAAEGGARALASLWWETLAGLARTAPREHLAQLRQDVAYALRTMRRTPGFTALAVLTLATGIGANAAIFSAVEAVLLRDLPYRDESSLAMLWNHWPGTEKATLSLPELLDFRERLESVEVAAWGTGAVNLQGGLLGGGEPERLRGAWVTANLLDVLGVEPALGRTFAPGEERRGEEGVVLLSHELWRRRFGGDPDVVGRAITLDGVPSTVAGVLPPGFVMPHEFARERAAVLLPLGLDPAAPRGERGSHFLQAAVRLSPGRSLAAAQAELDATTAAWHREYVDEYHPAYGATLWPMRAEVAGDVRPALLVLFGAVSLVLLIACANVANLLLARGRVRAREVAVRKAIGASQARLARQVLTEALVLAFAAAAVGLLLARGLIAAMVRTGSGIPRLDEVGLDPTVVAFTAGVAALTALVFGTLPALEHARHDVAGHLQAGRGPRSGLRRGMRAALVTAQVALALVLSVGAGLLIKSFARLLDVPAGLDPERVLTLRLSLPEEDYPDRERVGAFYDQLLERLRALPGVVAAGAVRNLPLEDQLGDWDFYLPGETPRPQGSDRPADWQVVTPDYFEAMGVPLAGGRTVSAADRADAPPVVVINQTLARTYFSGRDPVGQQILLSGDGRPWLTIVGVVGDVRHSGLDVAPNPQVYIPQAQFQPFRPGAVRSFSVAIRSAGETGDVGALAAAVRAEVRRLDRNVPIAQVETMESVLARSVAPRRLQTALLAAFAAIALVLSMVGTYGVLAYQITERTQELGVRMALGARAADILGLVLRQGMAPAAAGVVIGLLGAALLTRLLASLLFETPPLDLATFTLTAGALLLAALAACFLPARRATRVDPGTALRSM